MTIKSRTSYKFLLALHLPIPLTMSIFLVQSFPVNDLLRVLILNFRLNHMNRLTFKSSNMGSISNRKAFKHWK